VYTNDYYCILFLLLLLFVYVYMYWYVYFCFDHYNSTYKQDDHRPRICVEILANMAIPSSELAIFDHCYNVGPPR
jgi:hypothetical protein